MKIDKGFIKNILHIKIIGKVLLKNKNNYRLNIPTLVIINNDNGIQIIKDEHFILNSDMFYKTYNEKNIIHDMNIYINKALKEIKVLENNKAFCLICENYNCNKMYICKK